MQHQKPSEPDRQAKIVSLQAAKKKKTAHRHWGALLVEVRRDANVTLREIAEAFERYRSRPVLADLGLYLPQKLGEIKGITDKQYGKWERNEVAPKFNQLLSLYLAMTAGCGIEITPDERDEFLELAQEKIASKKYQYRENLSSSDWLWLREQIYKSDGEQRYRQVEEREAFQPLQSEDNNGQKAQKEQQGKETDEHSEDEFLLPDTSHIVGRDEIANILLSYLQPSLLGKPRIKVAVIQGVTGSGKSSVLKLLHKQITESSHDFEIHQHEFDTNSKNVTPIEYLDTFLARLLNWLEIPLPETAKLPPLEKRIDRAIKQMGKTKKRLVLMLDDFQVTLDQDGKLAGDWRRFLTAFCQGDHTATLYIASREWNTWSLGKSPYVTEHKLDFLSPEAGIQIWRNLGFEEDENLLALATEKCGGHPGMIEMVARHLQQPPMSFGWGKEMLLDSDLQESETGLIGFVKNPHIFSRTDLAVNIYPLLEDIISLRISSETRQVLDVLAIAPVPLAPALLKQLVHMPQQVYQELQRSALLVRDSQRIRLLPLVSESIRQQISHHEIGKIEEQLLEIYAYWLEVGEFLGDSEQSNVVAELIVLYLKHHRLFDAARLLIAQGWRCFTFGHAPRLIRLTTSVMDEIDWQVDISNKVGGTWLLYQLELKIGTQARAEDYQYIYDLACEGKILLHTNEKIHTVHHIMNYAVEQGHFLQAKAIYDQALSALSLPSSEAEEADISTYALAVYTKAHFLGSWSDYKRLNGDTEEAQRLDQECVKTLDQGIRLLRDHERHASPLKKRNIHYRLARFLHSYGYRQRLLKNFSEAKKALEACLDLKKAGAALPVSLAVTLGEYAQVLAGQGELQKGLDYNCQALEVVQHLIDEGNKYAIADKGMHLVERGLILLQQARLAEAKQLFYEALPLTTESRRLYNNMAKENIKMIEILEKHLPCYQLDEQWFNQYQAITGYDEIRLLTPAGPLNSQEQAELDQLVPHQEDEIVRAQISQILVASTQRELSLARQEQREPQLSYPLLAYHIDDIRHRQTLLSHLQAKIGEFEDHAIVRRLYLETIQWDLNMLSMLEATYKGDTHIFWQQNQALYPKANESEMQLVLSLFVSLLNRGLKASQTHDQTKHLIRKLRQHRVPLESLELSSKAMATSNTIMNPKAVGRTPRMFSAQTVRRFVEDILQTYHFSRWKVEIEPTRDEAYVSSGKHTVFIPNKPLLETKIIELLGEEIEIHSFRAEAGYHSPLMLLSLGLARYQATEEGLAYHYIEQIAQVRQKTRSYSWIGTLATGLASGVVSLPFSFHQLSEALGLAFTIRNVLSGAFESQETARMAAIQEADERALRTFRGVPNLSISGVCSVKDNLYLHGYLDVAQFVKDEKNIERLLVGKIAADHLSDMAELAIFSPALEHQKLALQSDLEEQISLFEEEEK